MHLETRIHPVLKQKANGVFAQLGEHAFEATPQVCPNNVQQRGLPFAARVPNLATLAAMQEARQGRLETVTLKELQAVLDADD